MKAIANPVLYANWYPTLLPWYRTFFYRIKKFTQGIHDERGPYLGLSFVRKRFVVDSYGTIFTELSQDCVVRDVDAQGSRMVGLVVEPAHKVWNEAEFFNARTNEVL